MNITMSGIMHHSGGYSELCRNLALVLNDLGVLVGINCRDRDNWQPMPIDTFCPAEYLKLEQEIHGRENSFYTRTPDTMLNFCPPFMFLPAPKGARSIGVTMFETRVPDAWYEHVDQTQYIMLHDEFQRKLFSKSKAAHIAWEPYVTNPMDSAVPKYVGDRFILAVGVARVHKNQRKLIEAFQAVRKDYPDVKLVIKAISEDLEFDDYRDMVRGDPGIHVYPGPFSTLAMDWLYQNCSLLVSASMCEGLDMPAIKAAMCGKPVILANHTGQTDWVPISHPALATTPVDMSTYKCIHPRYREKDMPGYDTTAAEIEKHIRAALENPGPYIIDLKDRFTRKNSAKHVANALNMIEQLEKK